MLKKTPAWLSLAALVILVVMTFASNPYVDFAGTDSAVFNYIGSAMHRGVVPYRDVFDHKGPLIYAINWLGSYVGPGLLGVWLLECLAAFSSFYLIWRWVDRHFGSFCAYFLLFPYAAFFVTFNYAGNLTETYAHCFVVPVMLWLFEAVYQERAFTRMQSFFSGLCFAAILLLRPNMGVIALVTAIYFCVECFQQKDWKNFLIDSILVLVGMGFLILPFVLYLAANQAIGACIDCYWTYNVKYAIDGARPGSSPYLIVAYLLVIMSVAPILDPKWRRSGIYNFLFVIFSVFAIWLKPTFIHYFLVLVPGAVLPLAWVLNKIKMANRVAVSYAIGVVSLLFVIKEDLQSNFDIAGYLNHLKKTHEFSRFEDYRESARYDVLNGFYKLVPSGMSVKVIGNECEIYRHGKWVHSGYFAFLPASFVDEMTEQIENEIVNPTCKFAITNSRHFTKFKKVVESNYTKALELGDYTLWKHNHM